MRSFYTLTLLLVSVSCVLCQAAFEQYVAGICDNPAIVKFRAVDPTVVEPPPVAYFSAVINQLGSYTIWCVNGEGLYFTKGFTMSRTNVNTCKLDSSRTCTTSRGDSVEILELYAASLVDGSQSSASKRTWY